jgi:hypothetical protein
MILIPPNSRCIRRAAGVGWADEAQSAGRGTARFDRPGHWTGSTEFPIKRGAKGEECRVELARVASSPKG